MAHLKQSFESVSCWIKVGGVSLISDTYKQYIKQENTPTREAILRSVHASLHKLINK